MRSGDAHEVVPSAVMRVKTPIPFLFLRLLAMPFAFSRYGDSYDKKICSLFCFSN